MSTVLSRLTSAVSLIVGCSVAPAIAQPSVPHTLRVPAGNEPFLVGYAVGTQNYICLPTPTGVAWRFVGPQATLFAPGSSGAQEQVTTHFLSANPVEGGAARPTWQHSGDTSQVWGRAAAASSDPNYVEPGAIPWLLVEIVGAALGPTGGATLTPTTYIHRVNTSGGVAPSSGCSDASHVGALALVPYTTDYVFYQSIRRR